MVDRKGDGPIFSPFRYPDDNKKKTFNNHGNKGHELENVTCKQIFTPIKILKNGIRVSWS